MKSTLKSRGRHSNGQVKETSSYLENKNAPAWALMGAVIHDDSGEDGILQIKVWRNRKWAMYAIDAEGHLIAMTPWYSTEKKAWAELERLLGELDVLPA